MSQKIEAIIVVDIGASLKLLHVHLRPQPRVSALKAISLTEEKKDAVILKSLADFIRENKITHKNCLLVPSLKSLFIKRLQLPAIPQAELAEAAKWKLKEESPFDLSGGVLDLSVIKETVKEDGVTLQDIICVAVREEEISPQVLLLKQAGLNCLAVIPAVFGYVQMAGRYFSSGQTEPQGLLFLGEEEAFFAIQSCGRLEFYRPLPLSRGKLREALKGVLVSDKGKVELSLAEAEEVIFRIGIPEGEGGYQDKLGSGQIMALLRPALERLAQEIRRSLNYYNAQFQGTAVKKIFLLADSAVVPNLDKFLSRELSLDIQKAAIEDKQLALPGIDSHLLETAYSAFGASLNFPRSINLLPLAFRMEKFEKLQKVSLRWVAFAAFLFLIFTYLLSLAGVASYQKRLESAQLHLSVLSEISSAKEKIDGLNNFIADIRKSEPPIASGLKKLSNLAPKEMFLDNFTLHCESKKLTISGLVESAAVNPEIILTKFMQNMEKSVAFADVTLSSIEKAREGDLDTVRFKLEITLR